MARAGCRVPLVYIGNPPCSDQLIFNRGSVVRQHPASDYAVNKIFLSSRARANGTADLLSGSLACFQNG